jgi:hypothetical protein
VSAYAVTRQSPSEAATYLVQAFKARQTTIEEFTLAMSRGWLEADLGATLEMFVLNVLRELHLQREDPALSKSFLQSLQMVHEQVTTMQVPRAKKLLPLLMQHTTEIASELVTLPPQRSAMPLEE